MLNKPRGIITSAKEISDTYNIPSEILAKILQLLAREGFVESCQGAKGGYVLTKDGDAISLADIVETLEGPVGIVECMLDSECNCMQLDNCNISDPFRAIQQQFKIFLSGISLADINNEIEMQRVWH
jgi:Rrf2 family protein